MAIYSLTVQTIGRGEGRSVVAAAAYRSCSSLTDQRLGMDFDFTAKAPGLVHAAILAPESAPAEFLDRQTLWTAADRADVRADAVPAREILVALPHELTDAQRRELVDDFARRSFVARGMIVDYAIHRPSEAGDARNHHAHILLTTRTVGPEGFGKKNPDWNANQFVVEVRRDWAEIANQHLDRHAPGVEKISEKTLADQGIDREPTQHKGPEVTAMERRGERTTKGENNRDIVAENRAADREERRLDAALIKAGEREEWVALPVSDVIARMEAAQAVYREQREDWRVQRDAIAVPKPQSIRVVERDLVAKQAAELRQAEAREDRARQTARDAGLSVKRLAQWYRHPEHAAMNALVKWNAELDRLAAARREREAAERALEARRTWAKSEPGQAAIQNQRQPDIDAAKAATTQRRTLERKIKRMDKRLGQAEVAIERAKVVDVLGKTTLRVPGDMFGETGRANANVHRYFKFNSFDAQQVIKISPQADVDRAFKFVRGLIPDRPAPILGPARSAGIEPPSPTRGGGPDR